MKLTNQVDREARRPIRLHARNHVIQSERIVAHLDSRISNCGVVNFLRRQELIQRTVGTLNRGTANGFTPRQNATDEIRIFQFCGERFHARKGRDGLAVSSLHGCDGNAVLGRGKRDDAVMRVMWRRKPLQSLPNQVGKVVSFHGEVNLNRACREAATFSF